MGRQNQGHSIGPTASPDQGSDQDARPLYCQEPLGATTWVGAVSGGQVCAGRPIRGELEASIRWPALLENATWARNEVVLYVQDWLPGNLRFVGKVLSPRPQMAYTPPAPSTPDWIINSSVQIEDVSKEDEEEEEEGLCEEDRLEIQAEMNRVKRPRMSD